MSWHLAQPPPCHTSPQGWATAEAADLECVAGTLSAELTAESYAAVLGALQPAAAHPAETHSLILACNLHDFMMKLAQAVLTARPPAGAHAGRSD